MATRVVKAPREKAPRAERGGIGLDLSMLAFIYAVISIGLLVGGTMNTGCAIAFLAFAGIGSFAVWIWLLVSMAMESVTKAILGFLCGLYALYWALTQCDNYALQKWVLITLLVGILSGLAQYGVIPLHGLESLAGGN